MKGNKSLGNNLYAFKLGLSISPKRVAFSGIKTFLRYFEWLFFKIFFIRYIINAIMAEKSFKELATVIALFCGMFLITTIINTYYTQVLEPLTATDIYQKLYKRLFAKAKNVELKCFEDAEFYNSYTMAIDNSADRVMSGIDSVFDIVFGVIAGFISLYALFTIDKMSVLFIIFPMIGNFFFGKRLNKMYGKRYEANVLNDRKTQYINRVMYLSDYAKEMRLSKVYNIVKGQYKEATDDTVDVMHKYSKDGIVNNWLQNVLTFPAVFEGIMLYSVYRAMISKTIGIGELAVMFTIMDTASWIIFSMYRNIVKAMENGVYLNNLINFMEYKETIPEDQTGTIPDTNIESIEFRNVTFYYKEDAPLIQNLSFTIKGGETIAFCGHNGAGKTTILKLLFRLYDPVEGMILVNGINIKEYELKSYRRLFATAFQDYKVFGTSIFSNVTMGREDISREEVQEALKKTGILDAVNQCTEKEDTVLTKEFHQDGVVFSGGQTQKLVLARVFAQPAAIKIFDEPSSALDPVAEYELYQNILKEKQEHTMIFISHRLSSVKDADRIMMFEHGKLIEEGTHAELMQSNGKYAEMYMFQAKNYLIVE